MDADSAAWLLSSASWGLGGLALGYLLGSMGREVHELKESLVKDETDTDAAEPETPERRRAPRRQSDRPSRVNTALGVAMVLLAVLSVTVAAVAVGEREDRVDRLETQVECESDYLVRYAVAINERTDAVVRDRRAIRTLISETAVIQASDDSETRRRERFRAAVEAFLTATAVTDETRENTPLPIPPTDCIPPGQE